MVPKPSRNKKSSKSESGISRSAYWSRERRRIDRELRNVQRGLQRIGERVICLLREVQLTQSLVGIQERIYLDPPRNVSPETLRSDTSNQEDRDSPINHPEPEILELPESSDSDTYTGPSYSPVYNIAT